jgi:drug/metabolite transporter (DMT)-like permease
VKQKYIGILFIIFAFFWSVTRSITVKLLAEQGLGLNTILFYQTGIALLVLIPVLLYHGRDSFVTKCPAYYLLRIVSGALCMYCFFWGLERTTLAKAVLLNNSAPLFVPFIMIMFFAVRFKKRNWISLIIGFIGIAFILRPKTLSVEIGDVAALISGVLAAFLMISVRLIKRTGTERTITVAFYFSLTLTIISGLIMSMNPQVPVGKQWLYIIYGSFGYLMFQIFFTTSFAFGKVSEISPFMYFGVLFAGIADWLVWKNVPTSLSLIGMLLVIFGGILSIVFNNKKIEEGVQYACKKKESS